MKKIIWLGLRLVMGFIFLWAFADKLAGLGFATLKKNAWLNGGSPTSGFLLHATKGPFATFFQGLAGVPLVDWLFMAGLLGIGLTFVFNRLVVWGAIAGVIMMTLMYLAVWPPVNNPLIDEHIVYALVFALFAFSSGHGYRRTP